MVIALLAVLVGLVLPNSNPTLHDQVRSMAQILRTDLAYARSLAVTNNSLYEIAFDTEDNRYVLRHSGGNAALDELPESPFRSPGDPSDEHIVDLNELPHLGPGVRILTVVALGVSPSRVTDVEFGPLGETTRSSPTAIWLAVARGEATRYMTVTVDPVTGLAEVGGFTSVGPAEALISAGGG